MEHVAGKVKKGKVVLFALSTCIWCKKTRALLEDMGVEYDYEYVDLAAPARQREIEAEIKRYTDQTGYPALIAAGTAVVGYRPDEVKRVLGV